MSEQVKTLDRAGVATESLESQEHGSKWYVDLRPLDVLLPHVPGLEVVSDDDAEWKCIARSQEIGEQISRSVNAYDSNQETIKMLRYALQTFVDYYDQAGIGDCEEGSDDRDYDEFDGDERFNVRRARAALAATEKETTCVTSPST